MAFLCVFVSFFMIVLIFKGQNLRKYNLLSGHTEDGMRLIGNRDELGGYDHDKIRVNPKVHQISESKTSS